MKRKDAQAALGAIVPTLLLGLASLACISVDAGETSDMKRPGDDTSIEPDISLAHALGGLAVEADERNVWVVNQGQRFEYPEEDGDPVYILEREARLVALTASDGGLVATNVLDVSNGSDRRMSFPVSGRAIYFEQIGSGLERMVRIDTATLTATLDVTVGGRFTKMRTSPTRNFIAAQTGLSQVALIHSSNLEHAVVPLEGFVPHGVWNHESDRLWTVTTGTSPPWARVKRHRVMDIDDLIVELDVTIDGFGCDAEFDVSWVAISPDDRWAVFPFSENGEGKLIVVDQFEGTYRVTPGSGPAGFTPDGSLIVSWDSSDGDWRLRLTDPMTLDSDAVDVPVSWAPEYFTAPNGSSIVITSPLVGDTLVLYDWITGDVTNIPTPHSFVLEEFVLRPGTSELWLASIYGDLQRLDLATETLERIQPGFDVGHLNLLPSRDALIMSEPSGGRVRIYDMGSRSVEALIELPDPLLVTSGG